MNPDVQFIENHNHPDGDIMSEDHLFCAKFIRRRIEFWQKRKDITLRLFKSRSSNYFDWREQEEDEESTKREIKGLDYMIDELDDIAKQIEEYGG